MRRLLWLLPPCLLALTACGPAAASTVPTAAVSPAAAPVVKGSVVPTVHSSLQPAYLAPGALVKAAVGTTGTIKLPRLPAAQPTPRTSLAPTPSATPATAPCPADLGPGSQIGMTVTPGVGSAVVSWIGPPSASSGIQGWLIAPVDQDASAAGPTQWHKVAAGPGCQTVTAKLGGLVSGHRYGFWLEATFVSAEDGLPEERMVGNAAPVVVR